MGNGHNIIGFHNGIDRWIAVYVLDASSLMAGIRVT